MEFDNVYNIDLRLGVVWWDWFVIFILKLLNED